MISASIAYNIVSGNMQKSLDRVASQATVKRDAEYYEENINKVKDVDDFLGNYRLYSYAMTAYGLDDMTYAKAFMKKVLESDLTGCQQLREQTVGLALQGIRSCLQLLHASCRYAKRCPGRRSDRLVHAIVCGRGQERRCGD